MYFMRMGGIKTVILLQPRQREQDEDDDDINYAYKVIRQTWNNTANVNRASTKRNNQHTGQASSSK